MRLDFLHPTRRRPPRPRHWSAHADRHTKPFVLRRDNYECQIRGPRCTEKATTVDHILPRSRGGSELPENLRAACAPCNEQRGNRIGEMGVFSTPTHSRPRFSESLSPRRNLVVAGDYSRRTVDGRR